MALRMELFLISYGRVYRGLYKSPRQHQQQNTPLIVDIPGAGALIRKLTTFKSIRDWSDAGLKCDGLSIGCKPSSLQQASRHSGRVELKCRQRSIELQSVRGSERATEKSVPLVYVSRARSRKPV